MTVRVQMDWLGGVRSWWKQWVMYVLVERSRCDLVTSPLISLGKALQALVLVRISIGGSVFPVDFDTKWVTEQRV